MRSVIAQLLKARIYALTNILRQLYVRTHKRLYRSSIESGERLEYTVGAELYGPTRLADGLVYKDETWGVVKNRFANRRRVFYGLTPHAGEELCVNDKVVFGAPEIRYNSSGIKNNWIYLFMPDGELRDYVFRFDATFGSRFREIQFGLRYRDFYNRYRFRIESGAIHFDLVKRGNFINSLRTAPFEVELDRTYRFEIVALGKKLSISIDGQHYMTVEDVLGSFERGGVALILWDDEGRPIRGSFANLSIHRVFSGANALVQAPLTV